MAVLTVQKPTADTPVVLNFTAASSGGDQFTNTGRERLHVKNGGAGAVTVTITAHKACSQGFLHHSVQSVAPTGASDEVLGPFDVFRFNDATNAVLIGYSGVASVTVAVEG